MEPGPALITEDWLKSIGFKWHQLERQPSKHWLLWVGGAIGDERRLFHGFEDLGIEVAAASFATAPEWPEWHCWFRSDCAGRYHRFIHLRYMEHQYELVNLIEALTDLEFNADDVLYGCLHRPDTAARLRQERERLDLKWRESSAKWSEAEKDDSRGGALPEHLDAWIDDKEKHAGS